MTDSRSRYDLPPQTGEAYRRGGRAHQMILATSCPGSTSCPDSTNVSASTPLAGASTSPVALSVSSSRIGSPSVTVSPAALSQRALGLLHRQAPGYHDVGHATGTLLALEWATTASPRPRSARVWGNRRARAGLRTAPVRTERRRVRSARGARRRRARPRAPRSPRRPKPPRRCASCATTSRPVRPTEARIALFVERAERAQVDHLGVDALRRQGLGGLQRRAAANATTRRA